MPAGASLYEKLTGIVGGAPMDTYDENTQEIVSVMDNITRILNTRAGALKHVPGYGLPDFSGIYASIAASTGRLKSHMEAALLDFEPRIVRIEIEPIDRPEPDAVLSYVLVCHLRRGGLVRLGTYFAPGGKAALRRLAR